MTYLNDVTAGILGVMAAEYVGVALAVTADLVSGVRKARREGDPCSSHGLRRTVSKLSSYYLLLFCLSVVDGMALAAIVTLDALGHPTIPPFPWLTSAGALSLALIEVVSIVENSPHRLPLMQSLKLLLRLLKR
ncbi:MAG: phage holin family protein [Duncaniella sp.]|nr:phage holin family protein [Duncaniella sp.]